MQQRASSVKIYNCSRKSARRGELKPMRNVVNTVYITPYSLLVKCLPDDVNSATSIDVATFRKNRPIMCPFPVQVDKSTSSEHVYSPPGFRRANEGCRQLRERVGYQLHRPVHFKRRGYGRVHFNDESSSIQCELTIRNSKEPKRESSWDHVRQSCRKGLSSLLKNRSTNYRGSYDVNLETVSKQIESSMTCRKLDDGPTEKQDPPHVGMQPPVPKLCSCCHTSMCSKLLRTTRKKLGQCGRNLVNRLPTASLNGCGPNGSAESAFYLGSQITILAKGEKSTEMAVKNIWKRSNQGKLGIPMNLKIVDGYLALTCKQVVQEGGENKRVLVDCMFQLRRITWCEVSAQHSNIFSWTYRHENKYKRITLNCHSVVLKTSKKAREMNRQVSEARQQAIQRHQQLRRKNDVCDKVAQAVYQVLPKLVNSTDERSNKMLTTIEEDEQEL